MINQKFIEKIREDFPFFYNQVHPPIYFDNACTSLKPFSVIEAQKEYFEKFSACAERSSHALSEELTKRIEKARQKIAKFIGAKRPEEIIFTKNATEAINLIAFSFNFKEGDLVLTSDKEHNSNLLPWLFQVKKRKIRHRIIPSKPDNTFDFEKFEEILNQEKNIRLLSIVQTSNLDGHTFPVKEIIKIAHQKGILVLLDSTQTVPHQPVNVKDLDTDFLVFSGHKMLGPPGIGVLYGKLELLEKLDPFLLGGGTVSNSFYSDYHLLKPPQKFEAGIQNYSGILGLEAAVDYLEKIGFQKIREQEELLNSYITEKLLEFPEIEIIGPKNPKERGSIISFIIKNKDSQEVALLLEEISKIYVRAGQFCVHSWFNARQIKSAVRASFYFYNTLEEAEIFIKTIERIIKL